MSIGNFKKLYCVINCYGLSCIWDQTSVLITVNSYPSLTGSGLVRFSTATARAFLKGLE